MSAKKNVHVPLRYHKIKTKKLGEKEENSKRKGLELKKLRKRIVVCRNYIVDFFHVFLPLLLFWTWTSDPCFYVCFHRLSNCILHFWTPIQAQRKRSERFKIISVYFNKAICSDRRYLWQIATAAFNHTLLAWDSDARIGIISSSATESKRIIRPGFFFKFKTIKTVKFPEPKVYTIKRRPLLTGKYSDKLRQRHLT